MSECASDYDKDHKKIDEVPECTLTIAAGDNSYKVSGWEEFSTYQYLNSTLWSMVTDYAQHLNLSAEDELKLLVFAFVESNTKLLNQVIKLTENSCVHPVADML